MDDAYKFLFPMGSTLLIITSNERGEVIGRAQNAHAEDCYNLRYAAADGRAVEQWWSASALENLNR